LHEADFIYCLCDDFFFRLFIRNCVDVGKSEDQFLFFLVIHQKWLMERFSVKMDAF